MRLVTRDDAKQVARAGALVSRDAWVSHLVLAETLWVLEAVYGRGRAALATAVEMLLNHRHISVQESETVAVALERYRRRPWLGFSHCLVLASARKAGHVPLGTFDRGLATLNGVTKL